MEAILDSAMTLRERGFAVHWLRPGSKIPVEKGWSDAPVATADELTQRYQTGLNLGFRAGKWSVVDGYGIIVLDIDIRGGEAYKREAWAACNPIVGDITPTVADNVKAGD